MKYGTKLKEFRKDPTRFEHGVIATYELGCRCVACVKVRSEKTLANRAKKRAKKVSEHLPLTAEDLEVGRCYRGKRPSKAGHAYVNDRQIRWISKDLSSVRYDSPAVRNGRYHPTITMARFLNWVSHNVTNEMPEEDWLSWDVYRANKKKRENSND